MIIHRNTKHSNINIVANLASSTVAFAAAIFQLQTPLEWKVPLSGFHLFPVQYEYDKGKRNNQNKLPHQITFVVSIFRSIIKKLPHQIKTQMNNQKIKHQN